MRASVMVVNNHTGELNVFSSYHFLNSSPFCRQASRWYMWFKISEFQSRTYASEALLAHHPQDKSPTLIFQSCQNPDGCHYPFGQLWTASAEVNIYALAGVLFPSQNARIPEYRCIRQLLLSLSKQAVGVLLIYHPAIAACAGLGLHTLLALTSAYGGS